MSASAAVWSWKDVASDSYPIEDGIPIPPQTRSNGLSYRRTDRFPLWHLEVGQSFLVPEAEVNAARHVAVVVSAESGRRFVSRSVSDGVRVWRVR